MAEQIVEAIGELITDHWLKAVTGLAIAAAGWLFARYRAEQEWKRRQFYHRINISLNSIQDGLLKIRTLSEKMCEEVFLNETAVRRLIQLAQETKPGLPVIPLPADDRWFFLNAVLNELSGQFATGLIAREAGRPVTEETFLICLTNEPDGDVKTRKVRAQVIRQALLENLPDAAPKLESPNHRIRWETLLHLAERWKQEPDFFLKVELVV